MQPRPTPTKSKYRIKDFAVTGNYAINQVTYMPNDNSCKLTCICGQFSLTKAKKCKRCLQNYHSCVANKQGKGQNWQCLHCQSNFMDPIFKPDQILLQTFFKTQSVYQYGNSIEFVFFINNEQLKNPVQIRGLQDGREGLAWPMQGQLYLNKEENPQSIIDFKPLLKNSNRKHRKQQALLLPPEKLKLGKNVLTFSIPKLNSTAFELKYQVQLRAVYFFGIYAIRKLSKEQLIQKTFKTSTIDKVESLQLLKSLLQTQDAQLSVQKIKLCLQCPYMKSRIKIPIRGKSCLHYMCICLDTLIQTRSGLNSRQWLCPICNLSINEPVIDMFVLSILNDGSAGIQVILYVNGNYEWIAFEDDDDMSISSDQIKNRKKQSQMIQQKNISNQRPKNIVQINVQNPIQEQTPKARDLNKVIQTIDLDDDIQVVAVSSVKEVQKNPSNRNTQNAKLAPFQIMVPEQPISKNKQKQKNLIKQKLKQALKEGKKKQTNLTQPEKVQPKKDQFLISDVKQLQFRPLNYSQFVKKYFNIEYNRVKVNEDLRIIFKEVL